MDCLAKWAIGISGYPGTNFHMSCYRETLLGGYDVAIIVLVKNPLRLVICWGEPWHGVGGFPLKFN